jgi:hypothetical protein
MNGGYSLPTARGFCLQAWAELPALEDQKVQEQAQSGRRKAPVAEEPFHPEHYASFVSGRSLGRQCVTDEHLILLARERLGVGVECETRDAQRRIGHAFA